MEKGDFDPNAGVKYTAMCRKTQFTFSIFFRIKKNSNVTANPSTADGRCQTAEGD